MRQPAAKSVQRFLRETKAWWRQHRHDAPRDQQQTLATKLRGVYQYFGLPLCSPALAKVRYQALRFWHGTLRRRSQTSRATWAWGNPHVQFCGGYGSKVTTSAHRRHWVERVSDCSWCKGYRTEARIPKEPRHNNIIMV